MNYFAGMPQPNPSAVSQQTARDTSLDLLTAVDGKSFSGEFETWEINL
jgi:hypothetical protein